MERHFLKCMAFASALLLPGTWAAADTKILTEDAGYQRVDEMPDSADLVKYYFIIVDKDSDLMMTLEEGKNQQPGHMTWYYKTSSDPAEDLNKVWTIEANNGVNGVTTGGYAFRSVSEPTYLMQTEQDYHQDTQTYTPAAWFFRTHDQKTPCEWTQFIFRDTTVNGVKYWMFENGKYPMKIDTLGDSRGYVGLWTPTNGYKDGEEVAANKKGTEIGHFAIYSILRTTFDALHDSEFKDEANKRIEEYQSVLDNSDADTETEQVFQKAIETAKKAVEEAGGEDGIEAALADLEMARQEYVQKAAPQAGHPFDMTFLIKNAEGTSTDGWSRTGSPDANVVFVQTNHQHWSGPDRSFLEIDNWNAGSWNGSMSQTVTLPNGKYTLRAAGRAANNSAVSLSLTANGQTYKFPNVGDTGGTIATDGSEWESVDAGKAAGKTFAHDGAGYGWEWSKLDTIIVNAGTLEIKAEASATVEHMWTSISDFKLSKTADLSTEEEVAAAKEALTTLVASAKTIQRVNVGDGAFQIPESAYNKLQDAITEANKTATATPDKTAEEYEAAAASLQTAIDEYKKAELNKPEEGKRYNVVLTSEGYEYDGKAVTYLANARTGQGGYFIQYLKAVDVNYAQSFTFTSIAGSPNTYKLSMTDSLGEERYVCTGTADNYGGNNNQIRTTTKAEEALPLEIQVTDKEGIYNLYNTKAEAYIGSQDAGVFTVNSDNNHIDFKLLEAKKADVTLDVSEGWATLILPFNAEIPEGLKAYTWSGEVGADSTLTLNPVEGSLAANTPYIVSSESKGTYSFSDYGLASDTVYDDASGHMRGYFANDSVGKAESSSYVLQKHGEELAFYKVGKEFIPVKPYRACLTNVTVPAGASYSALRFPTRDLPSHVAAATADEAPVDVYSVSGILVRSKVAAGEALKGLPKGIYVVNGEKKAVK